MDITRKESSYILHQAKDLILNEDVIITNDTMEIIDTAVTLYGMPKNRVEKTCEDLNERYTYGSSKTRGGLKAGQMNVVKANSPPTMFVFITDLYHLNKQFKDQ